MARAGEYAELGFVKEWLDKHPEVRAIVDRAIEKEWGPARIQAEIKQTGWWRNLTDAQREWSRISVEEPATARDMIADSRRVAQQIASLSGVRLSREQLDNMAERGARNQWTEDDYRVAIAARLNRNTDRAGDSQNTMAQIRAMSESYLVGVSTKQMMDWTRQVVRGDKSVEDFETFFRARAASLYKGVADDLRAGSTTVEIMQPYLEDAARELGVSPANLDLSEAKWTAALTSGDGKEALTREEWIAKIRTEKRYGYDQTWKARNEAAETAVGLLQMFGMR